MKRNLIVVIHLILLPIHSYCQDITEPNFQKADSAIWANLEYEQAIISELAEKYPKKLDSLIEVYNQLESRTEQQNIEIAIKFASVPSGLQRLYKVRLHISKDTLRKIMNNLQGELVKSEYAQSILLHINEEQVEEGHTCRDFTATNSQGDEFKLGNINSKYTLFIYGGLACMGEQGRTHLSKLYQKTDRKDLEIVVDFPVKNLKQLQAEEKRYGLSILHVSNFKGDHSPIKIIYGAQSTPTCYLIDDKKKVLFKETGLPIEKLEQLVSTLD